MWQVSQGLGRLGAMHKHDPLALTTEERAELQHLIAAGAAPARNRTHARISDALKIDPDYVLMRAGHRPLRDIPSDLQDPRILFGQHPLRN